MLGSDLLSKLSAQSGDQTMGLLHAAAERKKKNKTQRQAVEYHILGITCRKADPCRNIWPDFA